MGTSYAFPVLATSDAAGALRVARRLLLLSEDQHCTVVDGRAWAADAASVRRIAAAVPDGSVYLTGEPPMAVEVPEDISAGTFAAVSTSFFYRICVRR
jgi:hypothetical protein